MYRECAGRALLDWLVGPMENPVRASPAPDCPHGELVAFLNIATVLVSLGWLAKMNIDWLDFM